MLQTVKKLLRPGYRRLRAVTQQLAGTAVSFPVTKHTQKLARLGTDYGGWVFVDDQTLTRSVIVSCGLGEDASFDVEFAARYEADVIMVDPTPRAIEHYKGIASRIGQPSTAQYSSTGAQPVAAYDLSKVASTQLRLCEKALWNQSTRLRFYAPRNPHHVSHSIVNYQNDYSTETAYIDVEATTVAELLSAYGIEQLQLIKLDIEGAEVEVLTDMLGNNIRPNQVLVEYDELAVRSPKAEARVRSTHQLLLDSGYSLVHREGKNFTYLREEASVAGRAR